MTFHQMSPVIFGILMVSVRITILALKVAVTAPPSIASDKIVVTSKVGKEAHGLDRFFLASSLTKTNIQTLA